jgi:p-aminobenzoyl-glutamate transporter AbgT
MTEINAAAPPTMMQRVLDVVERVGNQVPHPVIIFVILILFAGQDPRTPWLDRLFVDPFA